MDWKYDTAHLTSKKVNKFEIMDQVMMIDLHNLFLIFMSFQKKV